MGYSRLGCVYCDFLRDFRKGIEFFQQGLAIAKEVGDKKSEGRAYGSLGTAYENLHDVSKAVDFRRKKVSIPKLIGDYQRVKSISSLGICIAISAIPKKQSNFCRQL